MMVELETPELLFELLLLLPAALDEGLAEVVGVSVTTTTLVTTWPPASVVTRADVTVVGIAAAEVAALEGLLEVAAGACDDDDCCCCAVDDGCAALVEDCCCCALEEAGAALVDAAAGVVGVSDVAWDAAAAGEVFAATEAETPWRRKMSRAAACSLSTRSPRDTTTGIRQPARVSRMPKVCAVDPVRILGRRR
jgi:hypothetical protein